MLVISKEYFIDVMNNLQGECIWLKINTGTVNVDITYSKFEFLYFKQIGKYKFGSQDYDEENIVNQELIINENDIKEIHKDEFASTLNDEQFFITMVDGTEIFIQTN